MVYFELNKYEYIKKKTTNNNQPNEKNNKDDIIESIL